MPYSFYKIHTWFTEGRQTGVPLSNSKPITDIVTVSFDEMLSSYVFIAGGKRLFMLSANDCYTSLVDACDLADDTTGDILDCFSSYFPTFSIQIRSELIFVPHTSDGATMEVALFPGLTISHQGVIIANSALAGYLSLISRKKLGKMPGTERGEMQLRLIIDGHDDEPLMKNRPFAAPQTRDEENALLDVDNTPF